MNPRPHPLARTQTVWLTGTERKADSGLSRLHPPTPGASNHAGSSLSPQGHLEGSKPFQGQHATLSWYGDTEGACGEEGVPRAALSLWIHPGVWFGSMEKWSYFLENLKNSVSFSSGGSFFVRH